MLIDDAGVDIEILDVVLVVDCFVVECVIISCKDMSDLYQIYYLIYL